MFFWFGTLSVIGVFLVFRDTAMDYRLVALGSLLPDPLDWFIARRSGPLHSVVVAVGVLAFTMLVTIGRRSLRRQLLAIPIGIFAHLVLDAAWANTAPFWWPFAGGVSGIALPVQSRALAVNGVLEVLGLAGGAWCVQRFQLRNSANRSTFVKTGRIRRNVR